jgi:hypothetical protein
VHRVRARWGIEELWLEKEERKKMWKGLNGRKREDSKREEQIRQCTLHVAIVSTLPLVLFVQIMFYPFTFLFLLQVLTTTWPSTTHRCNSRSTNTTRTVVSLHLISSHLISSQSRVLFVHHLLSVTFFFVPGTYNDVAFYNTSMQLSCCFVYNSLTRTFM